MPRGVPIELDRERHLRYPMSAVRKIEERFEISFMDGEEIQNVKIDDAMWLIMLGLEHEQPDPPRWWERALAALGLREVEEPLTQERLEDIVDVAQMEEIVTILGQALTPQKKLAEDPKKKAGGS